MPDYIDREEHSPEEIERAVGEREDARIDDMKEKRFSLALLTWADLVAQALPHTASLDDALIALRKAYNAKIVPPNYAADAIAGMRARNEEIKRQEKYCTHSPVTALDEITALDENGHVVRMHSPVKES